MSTLWTDIRYKMLHSGSKLGLLIVINVAVFLIIGIPSVFEQLFLKTTYIEAFSYKYLELPANLKMLAQHFWTPITYMFMHAGPMHILFNMLWLYWLGQIFEEYLGNKRTVMLYILGGLSGAAFFVAGINLIPMFNDVAWQSIAVVGASAGVMAIVVATATLLPDYEIPLMFVGAVKLKWLAIFYVILDFLGTVGPNAGGEIAHLGGIFMGFIYIKQLQRGNDWSKAFNIFTPKSKIKIVAGGASDTRSKSSTSSLPRQDEIDRILDKISQSGYDSLNKQEKEILFRASNNDR